MKPPWHFSLIFLPLSFSLTDEHPGPALDPSPGGIWMIVYDGLALPEVNRDCRNRWPKKKCYQFTCNLPPPLVSATALCKLQ